MLGIEDCLHLVERYLETDLDAHIIKDFGADYGFVVSPKGSMASNGTIYFVNKRTGNVSEKRMYKIAKEWYYAKTVYSN